MENKAFQDTMGFSTRLGKILCLGQILPETTAFHIPRVPMNMAITTRSFLENIGASAPYCSVVKPIVRGAETPLGSKQIDRRRRKDKKIALDWRSQL